MAPDPFVTFVYSPPLGNRGQKVTVLYSEGDVTFDLWSKTYSGLYTIHQAFAHAINDYANACRTTRKE